MNGEADEQLESFLWKIAKIETALPTICQIVESCDMDEAEVAGLLVQAVEAGLVDVFDNYGPETLFMLSTLASERMCITLTSYSHRWRYSNRPVLVSNAPVDKYWRREARKRDLSEEALDPLWGMVDFKQRQPHEILAIAEKAEERRKGDKKRLPYVRLFFGHNAIWPMEKREDGKCPACLDAELADNAYCLWCDNAGANKYLPMVTKSHIKQMPRYSTISNGDI